LRSKGLISIFLGSIRVGLVHSFCWEIAMLNIKEKITELIEQPLSQRGFEIADIVLAAYKGKSTLRVFVYGEKGVSLDQCAELSRLVGDIIDGTDLFPRGYTLELSSPGLDRPLTSFRDFKYRSGETVKISFADEKRKEQTAEIVTANDDKIEFKDESGSFTCDIAEIRQAKIVF